MAFLRRRIPVVAQSMRMNMGAHTGDGGSGCDMRRAMRRDRTHKDTADTDHDTDMVGSAPLFALAIFYIFFSVFRYFCSTNFPHIHIFKYV